MLRNVRVITPSGETITLRGGRRRMVEEYGFDHFGTFPGVLKIGAMLLAAMTLLISLIYDNFFVFGPLIAFDVVLGIVFVTLLVELLFRLLDIWGIDEESAAQVDITICFILAMALAAVTFILVGTCHDPYIKLLKIYEEAADQHTAYASNSVKGTHTKISIVNNILFNKPHYESNNNSFPLPYSHPPKSSTGANSSSSKEVSLSTKRVSTEKSKAQLKLRAHKEERDLPAPPVWEQDKENFTGDSYIQDAELVPVDKPSDLSRNVAIGLVRMLAAQKCTNSVIEVFKKATAVPGGFKIARNSMYITVLVMGGITALILSINVILRVWLTDSDII